jgi:AcrR family transcriptional regulator
MARPSLKEQRTEEILDAFARCVARYGVEGSTLERIAEEAGVKRTILRHYIGNRDDLIAALGERIRREFDSLTDELFDMLPEDGRVDWLIEALFHPLSQTSSQDLAVAQALIAAADHYRNIGEQLRAWVLKFDGLIARELASAYPDAPARDVEAVSFGILSIYFNIDALNPLALPKRFNESAKHGALRLVTTLET